MGSTSRSDVKLGRGEVTSTAEAQDACLFHMSLILTVSLEADVKISPPQFT